MKKQNTKSPKTMESNMEVTSTIFGTLHFTLSGVGPELTEEDMNAVVKDLIGALKSAHIGGGRIVSEGNFTWDVDDICLSTPKPKRFLLEKEN